jgi:predicted RNase H-like HicB family nuclease
MRYLVVIEETETGYSAFVPDLPGCISVGDSREEIESNIQEAILLHIEGIKDDGLEVPKPKSDGVTMIIPQVA